MDPRLAKIACLCLGLAGCASPPTNPAPKVPDAAVSPADASEAAEGQGNPADGSVQELPEASESGDAPASTTTGSETTTGDSATTAGDETPGENGVGTSNPTSDANTQPAQGTVTAKSEPSLPPPLFKKVDKSCGQDPGVGQAAKPMRLPSTKGKTIDLKAYNRRVVLLNFWGTWCKPCLKELPEFSRLYRRYRKYGLSLIAVATDDDAAAVDAMVKERKIAGKIVVGGQKLADDYRSPNFPFSFVVAPGGKITGSYRRYRPECMGKLEDDIRTELLKLQG